jgi:biopolymer transport protein ExbD
MMPKFGRCQRGATMVVALIMLVLLTLFAISAMNASNTSLRIASNTQLRHEVAAAVQQEIDKVMSVSFTLNPASVAGNKPVDINNDGAVDYNVVVSMPVCLSVVPVKNVELDIKNPADQPCFVSGTTNSLCSNTRWDISASATDPISGAGATIHQGVGVRVAVGTCL